MSGGSIEGDLPHSQEQEGENTVGKAAPPISRSGSRMGNHGAGIRGGIPDEIDVARIRVLSLRPGELGSRIARCNRSPSSLAGILMGYFANGFIFTSQPDFESSERRLVLPPGGGPP